MFSKFLPLAISGDAGLADRTWRGHHPAPPPEEDDDDDDDVKPGSGGNIDPDDDEGPDDDDDDDDEGETLWTGRATRYGPRPPKR